MSVLPDEIWRGIFEIGIENSKLSFKDLCCVSISCKRLNRLSNEDTLWSSLLALDFPPNHHSSSQPLNSSSSSSSKSLYKIRFERDKARKFATHRRAVLRIESQISVYSKGLQDLRLHLMNESDRMRRTAAELSNLHKIRQASVALNVWQPEIIRGRQKQIVEQCDVPVDSRIAALENEIRLCKQQIAVFDKAYRGQRQRLSESKEQLGSMKYHPLRDNQWMTTGIEDCKIKGKKKLKRCSGWGKLLRDENDATKGNNWQALRKGEHIDTLCWF